MKIITYSDLHLEFGSGWALPRNVDADLMILAGDVITFKDYSPLTKLGYQSPLEFERVFYRKTA